MRFSTAGESHGKSLIAYVEGVPAGLSLTSEDITHELARRRLGYGRGARQKFEQDHVTILSGVRHGRTLGSPITVEIANSEWPKWETVMNPDPVDPTALLIDAGTGDTREIARNKPLYSPRPGHADLIGMLKYHLDEARPVLERASARETAARVAAGSIARQFIKHVAGIEITSRVIQIGSVRWDERPAMRMCDAQAYDSSPVRCLDKNTEAAFIQEIDDAHKNGDTLGGVAEIEAFHVPLALGGYDTPYARLDASIARAMMSIQSVKGVEIGDGYTTASRYGSAAHDEVFVHDSHSATPGQAYRLTNRAGGIEGGMSNGENIRLTLAFKPISTVPHALRTINTSTGEASTALHQRSDTTAVVPGAVVAESMLALTLAHELAMMCGGASIHSMRENLAQFYRDLPHWAPYRKEWIDFL